jgi:ribose transport system ATP-binding protein
MSGLDGRQAQSEPPCVLRIRELSKRFGGTQAVDAVSLELRAGEILALLGENGAGKSTLIKVLAGVVRQDGGSIELLGEDEAQWRNLPKAKIPMAFIHQDLGLVEWMTVAENVALGMGFPMRQGHIDWREADAMAQRVLHHVGCDIDPRRRVFTLTRAEKSLLAIGRALETNARVLVLDEPTASLPMADVQRMFELLRKLRGMGVAMIYVSHRLDEIMDISDRAAVMRDGKLVGVRDTAQTTEHELVELIIGRRFEGLAPKAPAHGGQEMLRLDGVYTANAGPVTFRAFKGEVLGLIGLRGAGHEAVSRALFGLSDIARGTVRLAGQVIRPSGPAQAIAQGIALVAADRLEENLAVSLTVAENLFPNPGLIFGRLMARLARRIEDRQSRALIERFDVNPPAPQADVQTLSGGNQQKVVLARWMNLNKPLLILEEPTAGVDVGAKRQIYDILRQQAMAGVCVLVVSTDFEEVANVCNRALVFRDGLVACELKGEALSVGGLLVAASGQGAPQISTEPMGQAT